MAKTLSILLVTIPLAVLPPGLAAQGAPTAAEEAVRLLSAAQATDRKCGFLTPAERQELSRYTARAEIAAASQASSKTARTAADQGAAAGSAAPCAPDTKADVRETLVAAREAVAAANAELGGAQGRSRQKPAKAKAAAAAPADAAPEISAAGGIRLYARVVKAYYLERACLSLSRSDGKRFWHGIASLHRAVLAKSGRAAVARAMAEAERNAAGTSCGEKVLAQIERGYREIASRP